jgi:DNA-binding response OmpR family regulator
MSEAINLLKKEKFDLALVDGYIDDLENTCYRLNWLYHTPVVLIIYGTEADWNTVRSLGVDGFIPEKANKVESFEHFQTIARRKNNQLGQIKVLIIEDNEPIQEALRLSFQVYWPEAEVSFAALGQDGVKLARNETMDVILLDLKLPDVSGFDVLSSVRSFSQIPVIILTADRKEDDVIRAIGLGADDYVVKPFRQIELMSRIRQHINLETAVC